MLVLVLYGVKCKLSTMQTFIPMLDDAVPSRCEVRRPRGQNRWLGRTNVTAVLVAQDGAEADSRGFLGAETTLFCPDVSAAMLMLSLAGARLAIRSCSGACP